MPLLLKARYEKLPTETLKQELSRIEQLIKKEQRHHKQHPEHTPSPEHNHTTFTMEEIITLDTIRTIILDILAERRKKERTDIILYYIHFALIIGLIYILGTISDTITKNLTGSTQTIASLALVIIPLAIIIYLYRKITKR